MNGLICRAPKLDLWASLSVFIWRHGGHIGVPKQRNGSHIAEYQKKNVERLPVKIEWREFSDFSGSEEKPRYATVLVDYAQLPTVKIEIKDYNDFV